ncbi:hypothetical protein [Telluria beijingensis]|uniref:hypothetical protein n=1 Tax=Telluria beijingensis TaxID=3068633 RepID=UPI0027962A09|nr:hypothetical protein [Massilia sp. REN29]
MNQQTLIDNLMKTGAHAVPGRADVIALTPLTRDDARAGMNRFLTALHEADICRHDRANLADRGERSVAHLADGARAVVYHASGALQYVSGLAPFQAPYERLEETPALVRQLEQAAQRLDLAAWVNERGNLAFERLWQTKARGADRDQRLSDTLLVRATGAWRHAVDEIPVLGAASVALRLAGDGTVDALSMRIRHSDAEVLDTAPVIEAELAARQLAERLAGVLGKSKERLPADVVQSAAMRFGYLDLGRRKAQRVLAPAYVAQIVLQHRLERQAYVLAVSATERPYLELPLFGSEAPQLRARGMHPVCRDDAS